MPRDLPEPVLSLEQVLGAGGADIVKRIAAGGQLVFHAVGDTGSVRGPQDQELVADKMVADFDEEAAVNVPQFFFHLGDVIYNFGEERYYYDQFYEPYRDYPAPIRLSPAIMTGWSRPARTRRRSQPSSKIFAPPNSRFCPRPAASPHGADSARRVLHLRDAVAAHIALYSNVLEDPGVIASPEIGHAQLDFLEAALTRAKGFSGALIIAHHHPAYTVGSRHGWSEEMRAQIDKICEDAGVWPHAVLTGHAHNYQRFTRVHKAMENPLHRRRQRRPRRRPSQARARRGRPSARRSERR